MGCLPLAVSTHFCLTRGSKRLLVGTDQSSIKTENYCMKMQVNENRNTPTEMISPNCETRCKNLLAVPIFANGIVCSRYYFSF